MGWLVDVRNKIVAILQAGSTSAGVAATAMYAGPQLKRTYPYLFVTWKAGPIESAAMACQNWVQDFYIVVVHSASSGTTSEDLVLNAVENIVADLKAKPTLDGLVTDSESVRIEGETAVIGTEWGKVNELITAGRVTLRVTLRIKPR
jgi:hypothetical protein